jgi:hypothetical protein
MAGGIDSGAPLQIRALLAGTSRAPKKLARFCHFYIYIFTEMKYIQRYYKNSLSLKKIIPFLASSALFKKYRKELLTSLIPDRKGGGVSTGHLFLHCPGRG